MAIGFQPLAERIKRDLCCLAERLHRLPPGIQTLKNKASVLRGVGLPFLMIDYGPRVVQLVAKNRYSQLVLGEQIGGVGIPAQSGHPFRLNLVTDSG